MTDSTKRAVRDSHAQLQSIKVDGALNETPARRLEPLLTRGALIAFNFCHLSGQAGVALAIFLRTFGDQMQTGPWSDARIVNKA
jgi:hypothetical protein